MANADQVDIAIMRVHSHGRVVIPSEVRNASGIKDGDKVRWYRNDRGELCIECVGFKSIRKNIRYMVE